MSLPPIIKIKRGSGIPPFWTVNTGITAGEFAYNKANNVLYLGITGGYSAAFNNIDLLGAPLANQQAVNVIPIGMQISNDHTFGAGSGVNDRVGCSDFTVPTTRAVREYVNTVKGTEVLGMTLQPGPGIGVTYFVESGPGGPTLSVTVSNLGVLKGFTSVGLFGNFSGTRIYAKSAVDGLTFVGGAGIMLMGSDANGTLEIQNSGVISINGVTGGITLFAPMRGLSGFTAAIGLAITPVANFGAGLVTVGSPLELIQNTAASSINGIRINHLPSGSNAGALLGYISGVPQLTNISYNDTGHILTASNTPLSFTGVLPDGFTEAAQDAVAVGLTGGGIPGGITFKYDDPNHLIYAYNAGVRGICSGGTVLRGNVELTGGNNITTNYSTPLNSLSFNYTGVQLKSVAANLASVEFPSSTDPRLRGGVFEHDIDFGTEITANPTFFTKLGIYAGRGIGISFGANTSQNQTSVAIWNDGVNRISMYNNSVSEGNLLGPTGLYGPINFVAGDNISFSRSDNTITVDGSGGGGGGAITSIKAWYGDSDTGSQYAGAGLTGSVKIFTDDGLYTKQNVGPNTNNGILTIGLSSKIRIPAGNAFSGSADPYSAEPYPSELIITSASHWGGTPALPAIEYHDTPIVEYSRLVTDIAEGGLCGALSYGDVGNGPFGPFNPNWPAGVYDLTNTIPGKILALRAREGYIDKVTGFDPSLTGRYAELRLLGYPNAENMSSYIGEVFNISPNIPANDSCPNGCVGFPPVLPACWTGLDTVYNNVGGAEANDTSTAVFHADIVARDSVFVKKDIWLTGELIDANTGCLYSGGGNGGNSTNIFSGGNLGLTGDLVVGGSIYVRGITAHFNVFDFSTESSLLRIGGVCGNNDPYGAEYDNTATAPAGYDSDKGLILFNYGPTPLSPLLGLAAAANTHKTSFVGINADNGIFTYIPSATLTTNNSNIEVTGNMGPAAFSEINGVGITTDNTVISLIASNNHTNILTKAESNGHFRITANNTIANKAYVSLGSAADVTLGTISGARIMFTRGISFDVSSDVTNPAGAANALAIRYSGTDSNLRHLYIPPPPGGGGAANHMALVTTGLAYLNESSTGVTADQAQQLIYNKTLSAGTIIDCGTY